MSVYVFVLLSLSSTIIIGYKITVDNIWIDTLCNPPWISSLTGPLVGPPCICANSEASYQATKHLLYCFKSTARKWSPNGVTEDKMMEMEDNSFDLNCARISWFRCTTNRLIKYSICPKDTNPDAVLLSLFDNEQSYKAISWVNSVADKFAKMIPGVRADYESGDCLIAEAMLVEVPIEDEDEDGKGNQSVWFDWTQDMLIDAIIKWMFISLLVMMVGGAVLFLASYYWFHLRPMQKTLIGSASGSISVKEGKSYEKQKL